jgi:lipopolysaccharide transport system ATP-binding protein
MSLQPAPTMPAQGALAGLPPSAVPGVAIRADGLGKRYLIRHDGSLAGRTFREALVQAVARLWPTRRSLRGSSEEFWALKDVSFAVPHGEVLGIIGRNGAGKSTLLKLLSGITSPTAGLIRLRGRVASLLEVGTGFHPELTGRENVYLNGAILGMTRAEIRRKFDKIVAFAEVERFLDTPVKRYSSGMFMRLAFAVAAHLEPEILIIDEVLAVGDAAFQAKCLGKMEGVAQSGRTVLFVSHNMGAIQRLCRSAILLEHGQLVEQGPCAAVVERYLLQIAGREGERVWDLPPSGAEGFRPLAFRTVKPDGRPADEFHSNEPIAIEFEYELAASVHNALVSFRVSTGQGDLLLVTLDRDDPELEAQLRSRPAGHYHARCVLPPRLLNNGRYLLGPELEVIGERRIFMEEHALSIHVDATGGVGPHWPAGFCGGRLRLDVPWSVQISPLG